MIKFLNHAIFMIRAVAIKSIIIGFLCAITQVASAQMPWSKKGLSADDYLELVTQKIKEKNYKKAIDLSYEGLNNRPDYIDLHFMQGRAFMLYGNLDSARIKFKYVMTRSPRYRETYLLATNLEIQDDNKEEANCVINDGLYYFPFERDFMIKKLEVLDFNNDYKQAEEYADKLISVHYNDSIAMEYYYGYKLEKARYFTKLGNYRKAREYYEAVLMQDPTNKDASEGVYNIEIKRGSYQMVMEQINAELAKNPTSYEFLTKKVIILSDQYKYSEALQVAEILIKNHPGDSRALILYNETLMATGRFYMKEDPYLVFLGILEKRPTDKEALNYVINLATSRGLYTEALAYENKGLQAYPNDVELLQKRVGTLVVLQRYSDAANTSQRLYRMSPNNPNYREMVIENNMLSGRQNMRQLEYDSALVNFNNILVVQPNNYDAIAYSADVLAKQKKYDESLERLDRGLANNPDDERLLFKRAVILQDAGIYDLAAQQALALNNQYPKEKRYEDLVVDIKTVYAKNLMALDDYDGAREEYRTILVYQPKNMDALNGMINLESGSQRYDSALYYADLALLNYPDNRDFLLKKASVLQSQKNYIDAYYITGYLMDKYPYNSKIKATHIELLLASGNDFNKKQDYNNAFTEFQKVLAINPRDSNALNYATNILMERNSTDSALNMVNKALYYYPANETFTFKRALILEQQKDYVRASQVADSLVLINPSLRNIDFADALKARALKNQLGLMFLYTTFDSAGTVSRANIATLQYSRFTPWGSYTGRLNMAGRAIGTGLQVELDLSVNHTKKWNSFATGGLSNDIVFPSLRLGYTLSYNYKKTHTLEAGLRYLRFNRLGLDLISGVLGVTRYYDDFWGTIRYYPMFQGTQIYHTVTFSGRTYLTPATEYVSAGIGIGNSPDEFSRNFVIISNLRVKTYSFNMGYTKIYRYRNTFSVTGTWYNQELLSGYYRNQYDIFFMFLRKF